MVLPYHIHKIYGLPISLLKYTPASVIILVADSQTFEIHILLKW